jgi:hypothetical protein
MTIIKLTDMQGGITYANADHILQIITNRDGQTIVIFNTSLTERDCNVYFKETPEEIAKLIEKADPLQGIWEYLYRIEQGRYQGERL